MKDYRGTYKNKLTGVVLEANVISWKDYTEEEDSDFVDFIPVEFENFCYTRVYPSRNELEKEWEKLN